MRPKRLLVDTLIESPTFDGERLREYLELISQENRRLSRLVDNSLSFSRMERNKETFRLLEDLLRRAGRALTRDEIMDAVWGTSVLVTARSVDRCVTTLRAKIEEDPHRPRHIITIRDVGYRFTLPDEPPAPS